MREIYWLEWDEDNEEHVRQHGVEPAEIRELLSNTFITMANPRAQGRITMIGETNGGRVLAVALDPTRDPTTWRPVTALPASPGEIKLLRGHTR